MAPGGREDDDGIPSFLAVALTPPHPKSMANALESLVQMGAMDIETNDLTKLGQYLSCLSVEPKVGKMVIWRYILGGEDNNCTIELCPIIFNCSNLITMLLFIFILVVSEDALNMAVAMNYKSPFNIPPSTMRRDADEAKVELSDGAESDQVAV